VARNLAIHKMEYQRAFNSSWGGLAYVYSSATTETEIDGIAGSQRQKFKGDFSKCRRAHAVACIRASAREDSHRLCARLTTTSTTTTTTMVYAGAYK